MPRTTLAERQARIAQARARLQQAEQRLRDAERKARTRRLIEAGGLIDKAGLLDLDPNALYGALLGLAEQVSCPLSGGPSSMMEITRKGTLHAVEEAQARGDYREAA